MQTRQDMGQSIKCSWDCLRSAMVYNHFRRQRLGMSSQRHSKTPLLHRLFCCYKRRTIVAPSSSCATMSLSLGCLWHESLAVGDNVHETDVIEPRARMRVLSLSSGLSASLGRSLNDLYTKSQPASQPDEATSLEGIGEDLPLAVRADNHNVPRWLCTRDL